MNKSAAIEPEELDASDKMKDEFNKVKRDCRLFAKLSDMKSKIDFLQKELNYELEQLELVKNQSTPDYSHVPLVQPYSSPIPTYSSSNFSQQISYTNYQSAPYWLPTAPSNYYDNQYLFGYDNKNEAHAAFFNSLDKVNQMCNKEIKNTSQDISNLKKIQRDWMHCQPYNNLGSPAGDDMKKLNVVNFNAAHTQKDKSYGFQFKGPDRRGNSTNKVNGQNDLEFYPREGLNEMAGHAASTPHSPNVKRVRRAPNHPLPLVAHHNHLTE